MLIVCYFPVSKDVEHEYEPLGHPGPRAPAGFFSSSNSSMKGGGGHEYEPHIYAGPRAPARYVDVCSVYHCDVAVN